MKVAVVIVNYGTADLAAKAVESALALSDAEVHLVDNASPGNDAETLRRTHASRNWGDRVILWLEAENHGFGRGNNVVLNALKARPEAPDYVLLLNPDATLENRVTDILAAALEADPEAAAAGAAIVFPDGTRATSAFRFPGMVSALLETLKFGPIDRLLRKYQVPLGPDQPAGRVDWVSGAAVMFRFEALLETGFFDPDFFLYYEETELQNRLARAGWVTLFAPDARVCHDEGAATGQFGKERERKRRPAYLYQSNRLYYEKTKGRFIALLIALLVLPAACLNILQRRLRGKAPTLPLSFFGDHVRHVLWPLVRGRSA